MTRAKVGGFHWAFLCLSALNITAGSAGEVKSVDGTSVPPSAFEPHTFKAEVVDVTGGVDFTLLGEIKPESEVVVPVTESLEHFQKKVKKFQKYLHDPDVIQVEDESPIVEQMNLVGDHFKNVRTYINHQLSVLEDAIPAHEAMDDGVQSPLSGVQYALGKKATARSRRGAEPRAEAALEVGAAPADSVAPGLINKLASHIVPLQDRVRIPLAQFHSFVNGSNPEELEQKYTEDRDEAHNVIGEFFEPVEATEDVMNEAAELLEAKKVDDDLLTYISIQQGNENRPVLSVGGSVTFSKLKPDSVNECSEIHLSPRSDKIDLTEEGGALPPKVLTAVEFADVPYFIPPVNVSLVQSHAGLDLQESLTTLALDYMCDDSRILPGTTTRWRFHLTKSGGLGLALDSVAGSMIMNALNSLAFGFASESLEDDPTSGDLVLVTARGGLTFVHGLEPTQALVNKIFAGVDYRVYPMPHNDTAESQEREAEADMDPKKAWPVRLDEVPEHILGHDYWVDLIITTGEARAMRIDMWAKDKYNGYAILEFPDGDGFDKRGYVPVTIPLTSLYQTGPTEILFVSYPHIDSLSLFNDETILKMAKPEDVRALKDSLGNYDEEKKQKSK